MLLEKHTTSKKVSNSRKKLDLIQVLRGIAAVMVIVFHTKDVIPSEHIARIPLDFLFNAGPAGVDLFFILSGFIMVFVTYRSPGGLEATKTFLLKRFFRIWPLYAIAMLAYLVINYRYAIPGHLWSGVIRSLAFIPLSDDNPPFYGYPFLSVGWSLNYEVYFYLLLALSLLTKSFRWITFSFLIAITLIVIPLAHHSFSWHEEIKGNYSHPYLHMITNPIIWIFIYGVVIGLCYMNSSASRVLESIFGYRIVMALAVLITVYLYLTGLKFGHGPQEWGICMALITVALVFYDKTHIISYPKWLIYLGDISFSLYLWHLPMLALVRFVLFKLSLERYHESLPSFLAMMILTLVVSHFSYQYLEKRFARVIK